MVTPEKQEETKLIMAAFGEINSAADAQHASARKLSRRKRNLRYEQKQKADQGFVTETESLLNRHGLY
jgi:hypothetical protein